MAILTGTSGNDDYAGTSGVADTAVVDALHGGATWSFNGLHWTSTSPAGVDRLFGIDQVQFNDSSFTLTLGGETPVNTTTGFQEYRSQVVQLKNGGYVVVWESTQADGSFSGIYAQIYNDAGERIGGEFRVNTTTAGAQQTPTVAALGDGSFVVGWASDIQDGSSFGVYTQRFSATGAAIGVETLANTVTTNSQEQPHILALSSGGYVVTWQSPNQDSSSWGIYGQRYNPSGTPVGTEFLVNTTVAQAQTQPIGVALPGANFVIAWTSDIQDGSGTGVYFQRFGSTGLPVGPETRANTTTLQSQGQPAITALNGGGFLVTWASSQQDGSGQGIYAQRFDAAGVAVGVETLVNQTTLNSQDAPSITALSDGGYVVVWHSGAQAPDGSSNAVIAQRFDSSGARVGGEVLVNTTFANDQSAASVAALPGGGYVVTWQSLNQDGTGYGIYSQRFDGNNQPILPSITGDDRPNIITSATTGPVLLVGGGGNDTLTSGAAADVLDGGAGNDTLRGGLGNDTYIADVGDRIIEGISGGIDTVQVSGSYTMTAQYLENIVLTGTAAANLIGNGLANDMTGNSGDNSINGGVGADTMRGGAGNDSYFIDNVADVVIENAGAGIDTIISSIDFTLGDNQEILRLNGSATQFGIGNALDNQIYGNEFVNVLDGAEGADTLVGDAGNDTYYVDAGDLAIEEVDEGIDTVIALSSWTLGANFESLTLGGVGAHNATGNDLGNVLIGNAQDNVLDGGEGIDSMNGGDGNDTYIVDNSFDQAGEFSASTGDQVRASATYTLGNGIENLTLTGALAIDGTGNGLNNVIRGNNAANILDGGSGIDTLIGGYGNDTLISTFGQDRLVGGVGDDIYIVSGESDDIVELTGQGIDIVNATVTRSYTLGLNVDRLVLFGGNVDGFGNSLNNQLTGTAGSNLLDGGSGNDRMTGLLGNDSYVVDAVNDVIIEALAEGTDQIYSSVTFTISANVENMTLTGAALINGTGNALRNRITGNDARNTINGQDGNDTLIGGGGADLLYGDLGNDVLNGGAGNDRLDGGAGTDQATYYLVTGGVTVNLSVAGSQNTVSAGNDILVAIENIDGSNIGGDTLTGNTLANRLNGNGGNDSLTGGDGNDIVLGGEGDDVILADLGNDVMDGGNGLDRASFAAVAGTVTIDLNLGGAQDTGSGLDTIRNIEIIEGSATGNDVLIGDGDSNTLLGLGGNDMLAGGDGADTLDGGDGADTVDYSGASDGIIADLALGQAIEDGSGAIDTLANFENLIASEFDDSLWGSAGNNRITAGMGRDIMAGNGGADIFVLRDAAETGINAATWDVITDFLTGDRIDLSLVDANTVTAGIQDFTVVLASATAFTAAGQLRLTNGVLYGNTDADAAAEFAIQLQGVTSITLGDFIL